MKKFRFITSILIILLLMLSVNVSALENSTKDETVYGILNYDGTVEKVYIVNTLYSDNHVFTDYGDYEEITNLTSKTVPEINGDQITFSESESSSDRLSYQGTLTKQLPYLVSVEYFLNDTVIKAEELGGQKGRIDIHLSIEPNLNCEEDIRDGYMVQATVTLDLNQTKNIEKELSNAVITGNTMTVSYTVLEGESGQFVLSFDTEDFTLDPINIVLVKSSFSLPDSITKSSDSFDVEFTKLIDGYEAINGGTKQLENGLVELIYGVKSINEGLSALTDSNQALKGGLDAFFTGFSNLQAGSNDVKVGFAAISEGFTPLNGGVASIAQSTSELALSHEALVTLAGTLMSSNDPNVRALAQGVIDEYEGIKILEGSLLQVSNGLNEFGGGLTLFVNQYNLFHEGLEMLNGNGSAVNAGLTDYFNGAMQSSEGLSAVYAGMEAIPAQIAPLTEGQEQLQTGLVTTKSMISSMLTSFTVKNEAVVSFASSKNNPSSVQYVLSTSKIDYEKKENGISENEEKLTFWQRIANLFKF